jgi:hypothetical protein
MMARALRRLLFRFGNWVYTARGAKGYIRIEARTSFGPGFRSRKGGKRSR